MFNDEEKEFDPSESEEFMKAINDVLELPDEPEGETINLASGNSQLIQIPDTEEETEVSDSEIDEYDAALASSIADLFGDIADETGAVDETADTEEETTEAVEENEEPQEQQQVDDSAEQESFDDYIVSLDESFYTQEDFPREDQLGEEEIFDDINAALALQVNEMDYAQTPPKKSRKWLLTLIPLAGIVFLFTKFRKGMPKWLMGLRIAVFSIFAAFILITVASGGKVFYSLGGAYLRWKMPGEATTPTPPISPDNQGGVHVGEPEQNPADDPDSPVQVPANPPRTEDHIVNILLLGEEKIGSEYGRGRTDLIMIATLDTEQRSVKLTSLMRDMLVAIPGHTDNRINTVYQKGGVELLYEVIETNFEIVPDGYMLVDFDSFEQVINNLDGVNIELTAEEAEYLNTTNYISNPAYRNVVPGLNKMNGNQALGYCRIRHVATANNAHSDFGRTSRQRVVLNAIFEKMKTKNLFQLAIAADACLPLVETDLSATQLSEYMEKAVESRITSFEQMRIPINGSFSDATYNGITDLIQINFPENIRALHEFIFGDYEEH